MFVCSRLVAPAVVNARLVASTLRVAVAVGWTAFREWQQARHDQDSVLITALATMGKLFLVANNRRNCDTSSSTGIIA
jgi:hypothetical protein